MSDKEIIDQVDGWHEERLKNERYVADLKHKRWTGFGRFLKSGVVLALVGSGLWFGGSWAYDWNQESDAKQAVLERTVKSSKSIP